MGVLIRIAWLALWCVALVSDLYGVATDKESRALFVVAAGVALAVIICNTIMLALEAAEEKRNGK